MLEKSKKTGFSSETGGFQEGAVCPMPGKGGIGSAKGAMGSAIVTLLL